MASTREDLLNQIPSLFSLLAGEYGLSWVLAPDFRLHDEASFWKTAELYFFVKQLQRRCIEEAQRGLAAGQCGIFSRSQKLTPQQSLLMQCADNSIKVRDSLDKISKIVEEKMESAIKAAADATPRFIPRVLRLAEKYSLSKCEGDFIQCLVLKHWSRKGDLFEPVERSMNSSTDDTSGFRFGRNG